MGLSAGPVHHDPGSWGQDINKAAPWSSLDPFPLSLILPFFLRLPQLPSSSIFGVLSLLQSLAVLRRAFSFIDQIFSEAPLCAGPSIPTPQHGVDICLEQLPAPSRAPLQSHPPENNGQGAPVQQGEPWDQTWAGHAETSCS